MKIFKPRPNKSPKIYGYTELSPEYDGLIKIGYTERDVKDRMKEHYPTLGPKGIERYKVLIEESSMRNDGTSFIDKNVHRILENAGLKNVGGEWFKCSCEDVKAAIIAAKNKTNIDLERFNHFALRPEQIEAIDKTKKYFTSYKSIENKAPHFLWNCKMRFGKTFAAYKLAVSMEWKKILILSFKTAVEDSWQMDLMTHIDFNSWQFIQGKSQTIDNIDQKKPFACFASFQDFLGKNKYGGIKIKNQWAHLIDWDCIILDEYHYGAWNENAKGILSPKETLIEEDNLEILNEEGFEDSQKYWDEDISPLSTKHYLYLSGTPFRALNTGEFIEEQIYNWTYIDEQKAKENWDGINNPYISMPKMIMMTYDMPECLNLSREDYGFNLNEFFKASGEDNNAKFKYEDSVQKWLDLIRGVNCRDLYADLSSNKSLPVLPFSDTRLVNVLNHTFWFLPSISSCNAMKNLLMKRANYFYHDYEIIVCAGNAVGTGIDAIKPVRIKMSNPLSSKTITLSCGKLNTGVTVKPWTGVFFLRDTESPETYFQTAFRVQSPWQILDKDNHSINLKDECFIFDFSPNRALKLLTEYSLRLDISTKEHEEKIENVIKFLPILSFDGSSMKRINAEEVLSISLLGTSGSQLAKKFECSRLVRVDDLTLKRIIENKEILEKILQIEGFRNINSDIEKIINKSEKIKNLRKKSSTNDLSKDDKKELTDEQKQQKSLRRKIQEKLQKFASRIPIFIYLTDYREETLKDVIMQLEPELFKKVTSLDIKDFELLISLGLFNSTLMNAAIFSFKRYENASLHYQGLTKHNPKKIGLFDTKISIEEFFELK